LEAVLRGEWGSLWAGFGVLFGVEGAIRA